METSINETENVLAKKIPGHFLFLYGIVFYSKGAIRGSTSVLSSWVLIEVFVVNEHSAKPVCNTRQ